MAVKKVEAIEGCFAAAGDEEPLFVLRATDPRAPSVVRHWANLYFRAKVEPNLEKQADCEEIDALELIRRTTKYQDALKLADDMQDYYMRGQEDKAEEARRGI